MPLVIEQFFPQGRFHATRWRENPFADAYGEWPPSPWRLLRALAARWFQYSRETGDRDEAAVERLLRTIAAAAGLWTTMARAVVAIRFTMGQAK